ncbi:MAG: chromosomal replication initiator protein DnaA [Marinifilaceae bacterium]|nr:chromosomal replication initiator protein DnaA [Marinifilaceae bacterium]
MQVQNNELWSRCLDYVSERVEPKAFKTLFANISVESFDGASLVLRVSSDFICEQLDNKYSSVFATALKNSYGFVPAVSYNVVIDSNAGLERQGTTAFNTVSAPKQVTTPVEIRNPFEKQHNKITIDSNLSSEYTIDNFVLGDCNRLAYNAALAIADHPGTIFNPMFLWGASGLGKTHLVNAIGLEVQKRHPEKSVLYLSANLFMRQFVEAKMRDEVNDFIHFYQLIDVLILDDVQDFAGKTGTQNTFFHIFNHLHQSGKQVIMTCDKDPNELEGIEDRLISRFKWSLVAKMDVPDFQTRKDIIVRKAKNYGMELPQDILELIAKRVSSNVRELEGILTKLMAYSIYLKSELNVAIVEQILGPQPGSVVTEAQPIDTKISLNTIRERVCAYFNINESALQCKTRQHDVVEARQIAMYFAKKLTNDSLSVIGNAIGKKDHSTVLYSCRIVENRMSTNSEYRSKVNEIHRYLIS